jgi:hypothetical protein
MESHDERNDHQVDNTENVQAVEEQVIGSTGEVDSTTHGVVGSTFAPLNDVADEPVAGNDSSDELAEEEEPEVNEDSAESVKSSEEDGVADDENGEDEDDHREEGDDEDDDDIVEAANGFVKFYRDNQTVIRGTTLVVAGTLVLSALVGCVRFFRR